MTVKKQRPIRFLLNCPCSVNGEELEDAVIWYAHTFFHKPVIATKKIFQYGRYPAVAIHREKIHIHRLLMISKLRRKLRTKEYVNHIDGDKSNALMENLEIMSATQHQQKANKGRK